jgi:cell division protein FtsL
MNNVGVARKKAVGAEYLYGNNYDAIAQENPRGAARRKARAARLLAVVAGLLVISSVFAVGFGYVCVKARVARLNWELEQIKGQNVQISANIEKIKLNIASQKSPERIEYLAASKLGMVKTSTVEYLALGDTSSTTSGIKQKTAAKSVENPKNEGILRKIETLIAKQSP